MEGLNVCGVKTCRATREGRKVRMFRYPKDLERCKLWAIAAGQLPFFESKAAVNCSLYNSVYRLCSLHFDETCYAGPSKRRLKTTAIPTLLLPILDSTPANSKKNLEDGDRVIVPVIETSNSEATKLEFSTSTACSLPKYELNSNNPLLEQLITDQVTINLPSDCWILHKIVNKFDVTKHSISIMKLVAANDGRQLIEKQVCLSEDSIKAFICDFIHYSSVYDVIQSVEDLEFYLNHFDELPVCYGGIELSECSRDFTNPFYKIDSVFKVLRHVDCKYILVSIEYRNNTCMLCQQSFEVARTSKIRQDKSKETGNPTKGILRCERIEDVNIKNELDHITIKEEELDYSMIKVEEFEQIDVKMEPINGEMF